MYEGDGRMKLEDAKVTGEEKTSAAKLGDKPSFKFIAWAASIIAPIAIVIFLFQSCQNAVNDMAKKSNNPAASFSNQTQAAEQTKDSSAPKVFKTGESATIGNFSFLVKDTTVSKQYNGHKTDNLYVILTIEASNVGQKPESVDSSYFLLVDNKGRNFKAENDILSFSNDSPFVLTDLNPGLKKTGKVAFEIPDDGASILLAVRDNMFDFGGAKYVYMELKPEFK
jgi:hypothetical protein